MNIKYLIQKRILIPAIVRAKSIVENVNSLWE